ncbi:hypothetical protein Acr_11g0005490 [Actinidia rufa]|uniref:Uncharacterized protein n=1 Tax=Actinidia rufa TaxID=165716 RepID=A0A7J0FCA7_9ERIC|nr:hypothetical protein Acr_11g0005490 [Actinidia rufa]
MAEEGGGDFQWIEKGCSYGSYGDSMWDFLGVCWLGMDWDLGVALVVCRSGAVGCG